MPNSAVTPPHCSIALSFCPERAVSVVCVQSLTFAALRDPPVQLWAPSRPCRAQACQGAPAIAEARDSFCEGNQPTETARTGLADSSERAGLERRAGHWAQAAQSQRALTRGERGSARRAWLSREAWPSVAGQVWSGISLSLSGQGRGPLAQGLPRVLRPAAQLFQLPMAAV